MKSFLFATVFLFLTSAWAGPIDNCYSDNFDVKEASLCADRVLAKRIRRISKKPSGNLQSCTLTVCIWEDLTDPEDRHDSCAIENGQWKYTVTYIEARNDAHAITQFSSQYEDVAEAQAAVKDVTCN